MPLHVHGAAKKRMLIFFVLFGLFLLDGNASRVRGAAESPSHLAYGGRPVAGATREFWFDTRGPASWRRNVSRFATTRPFSEHTTGASFTEEELVGEPVQWPMPNDDLETEALCLQGGYIDLWKMVVGNVTGRNGLEFPLLLSFQGICNDGEVLPSYSTSAVTLGFNVTGRVTVEVAPTDIGFEYWQGRIASYLVSFQGVGEDRPYGAGPLPGQGYVDYCPPGMFVSGYQVNAGSVLNRIRVRCSCITCGCDCLNDQRELLKSVPQMNVGDAAPTSGPLGTPMDGVSRGCLPPMAGLPKPFCFVDNSTCSAPVFSLDGLFYDYCFAEGETYAMDTEKTKYGCSCKPNFNVTLGDGTLIMSGGRCIKGGFLDTYWCPVLQDTCNHGSTFKLARNGSFMYDTCERGRGSRNKTGELRYSVPAALGSSETSGVGSGGPSAGASNGSRLDASTQVIGASASHTLSQVKKTIIGIGCGLVVLILLVAFYVWKKMRRRTPNGPSEAVLSTSVRQPLPLESPQASLDSTEGSSPERDNVFKRARNFLASSSGLSAQASPGAGRAPLQIVVPPETPSAIPPRAPSVNPTEQPRPHDSLQARLFSADQVANLLQHRLVPPSGFRNAAERRPLESPFANQTSSDVPSAVGSAALQTNVLNELWSKNPMELPVHGEEPDANLYTAEEVATWRQGNPGGRPPNPSPSGESRGRNKRQTAPEWEVDPADVTICSDKHGNPKFLGKGGFGTVYQGWLKGHTPVAVKYIYGKPVGDEKYVREVGLLRGLNHPNILRFLGAAVVRDQTMLVTELLKGGDLHSAVCTRKVQWPRPPTAVQEQPSSDPGSGLQESEAAEGGLQESEGAGSGPQESEVVKPEYCGLQVMTDVARGLSYLHERQDKIAHLDIKSSNILLDGACAKIGDVGFAKVVNQTTAGSHAPAGISWAWAAPELILNSEAGVKSDIYSFGIVLWEVITQTPAERGKCSLKALEGLCTEDVCELARKCRDDDPAQRPTAREILNILDPESLRNGKRLPSQSLAGQASEPA
eukprot:jgi/Botrbrau1/19650/Bobra.0003s0016.2